MSRSDVFVISQVPPPVHGSTLMTKAFLQALDHQGITWKLIDRRFSTSIDEIGKFRPGKVLSAVGLVRRLTWDLLRTRPRAVILFATTRTFSFIIDWALAEITRFLRVPLIVYPHTQGFTDLAARGGAFRWLVHRLLSAADAAVVLGESLREDIQPFISVVPHVIPNTLPEDPPSTNHTAVDRRRTVLFLSNLVPGKGYEDFLSVAARVLQERDDVHFAMVGAAAAEVRDHVQSRIEDSPRPTHITYEGPADDASKWGFFAQAKVLVFPSEREASPLVHLEALASGVPIVGYRTGALAAALNETGAGRMVSVGDEGELYGALREVLESRELQLRMSHSARKLYEESLSFDSFKDAWGDLLERLIYQS